MDTAKIFKYKTIYALFVQLQINKKIREKKKKKKKKKSILTKIVQICLYSALEPYRLR